MKTFITSDNHFDHANIIKHCQRPFDSVYVMNQTMINNWNDVVTEKDRVIVVGDFAWKNPEYWLNQLKGTKILIKGNHDHKQNRKGWDFVKDLWETSIEGQRVVFCHYQMAEWNASFHGSWHLYGHSHGNAEEYEHKLSFDVGVDLWDFYPIEWSQIVNKMKDKEVAREIWKNKEVFVPGKNRIEITKDNVKYLM